MEITRLRHRSYGLCRVIVASANNHHDGQWVTLVDTEETVHDLMRRTHGSMLLNLDDMDETSSVQGDEIGLLSSKVVDVPSQKPR